MMLWFWSSFSKVRELFCWAGFGALTTKHREPKEIFRLKPQTHGVDVNETPNIPGLLLYWLSPLSPKPRVHLLGAEDPTEGPKQSQGAEGDHDKPQALNPNP